MKSSLVLFAIGLALVVAGCQRAPEKPASEAPAAVDHVAEAKKALAVANWAAAAPHLRAALREDPASLFLHYNLAICATWLGLKDEAIREFDWVVAHAASDSEEAKTARRWLAANRDRKSTETALEATPDDPAIGDSGLHGVVTWAEPGLTLASLSRQQLFLVGLKGTPTQQINYVRRSDEEGRYELKRITPGQYKLTDAIAGPVRWRLKVTLEPGQDLLLDLTPDNSVARRDDFPDTK